LEVETGSQLAVIDLDSLTARELDAQVAQRVFGLTVEERRNARTGQKDFVHAIRPGSPNQDWVRVAYYSASTGAAINVELALRDRGWTRTEPQARAVGDVRVVLEHADGRTVEAFGPVNTALCLAALKAVSA
jgi:hypothetical protein